MLAKIVLEGSTLSILTQQAALLERTGGALMKELKEYMTGSNIAYSLQEAILITRAWNDFGKVVGYQRSKE
jgi:hypothetical protein